jgi:hypothetical protein
MARIDNLSSQEASEHLPHRKLMPGDAGNGARPGYDAFISYSHAVDGKLAPSLQTGLQRFAKPWYRLRAMRVFRDQTNLSASPHLWNSIQEALDSSRYFILLASPEAARSEWVEKEVGYWLDHKPRSNLLIAVTDGELAWNSTTNKFDRPQTTSLPPSLMDAFEGEPLYVDLRWARSEHHVSSSHPRFRECVADLAATLQGRAKDEIVGEDVRQHRRAIRLARAAVALLALSISGIGLAGNATSRHLASWPHRRLLTETIDWIDHCCSASRPCG